MIDLDEMNKEGMDMTHKRLPDESYKSEWYQAHHSLRRERTNLKANFEHLTQLMSFDDDAVPLSGSNVTHRYLAIAKICERIANNARRTANARERYVAAKAVHDAINRYSDDDLVRRHAGIDADIALGNDLFFKDAVATNKLFVSWCNMYAQLAQASSSLGL